MKRFLSFLFVFTITFACFKDLANDKVCVNPEHVEMVAISGALIGNSELAGKTVVHLRSGKRIFIKETVDEAVNKLSH